MFLRPGRVRVRGRGGGGVGVGRGRSEMGKRRGRKVGGKEGERKGCKEGVLLCCCLIVHEQHNCIDSTFVVGLINFHQLFNFLCTVALINHCCSLSWKVCLRASTSVSGQRGISLLMSIF